MSMKLKDITPLLAAGAAAVVIAAAPTAFAADQQSCNGERAREPTASRPATFRSSLPRSMFSTTPLETSQSDRCSELVDGPCDGDVTGASSEDAPTSSQSRGSTVVARRLVTVTRLM